MRLSFESKLTYLLHHRGHLVECCVHGITCMHLNSCNACGQVDVHLVNTIHGLQKDQQLSRLVVCQAVSITAQLADHGLSQNRLCDITLRASATRLEQPSHVIPSTFSSSSIKSAEIIDGVTSLLSALAWRANYDHSLPSASAASTAVLLHTVLGRDTLCSLLIWTCLTVLAGVQIQRGLCREAAVMTQIL